jgi:hypothetical protein
LQKTRQIVAMFLRQRCIEHLQRDATILRQATPGVHRYSATGIPQRHSQDAINSTVWTTMYQRHEQFLMHSH